jgi:C4-dicarboxylate transporter DctQ subunit
MDRLRIIEDKLCCAIKIFTAAILFFQMTVMFIGVICRYFFNVPQPWVDEISTYLLTVVTYMGGYVALREGRLAKIAFLLDAVNETVKKVIISVGNIMIMVLMAVTTYYSYFFCTSSVVLNQITSTLRIPMIVFYALVPISTTLMFISSGVKCAGAIMGIAPIESDNKGTIE